MSGFQPKPFISIFFQPFSSVSFPQHPLWLRETEVELLLPFFPEMVLIFPFLFSSFTFSHSSLSSGDSPSSTMARLYLVVSMTTVITCLLTYTLMRIEVNR